MRKVLFKVVKDKKSKLGYSVKLVFQIGLHKKDLALLNMIRAYFGGRGKLYEVSSLCAYQVRSVEDLKVIIKHFDDYPLISQKRADFELFKQAFELTSNKKHLTKEGLQQIVNLKASINNGLSAELKEAFPDTIPVQRPLIIDQAIQNPHWLAGFAAGEGCFSVSIFKDTTNTGFTVKLIFILAQHSRDMALLQSLVDYLGCGRYTPRVNQEAGDFMVTKFADFRDKIIPFFAKYPIAGVKSLDLADFCKVAELMQQKAHLTEEGLAEIRLIKAGMNLSRAKLLTSGADSA